MRWRVLRWEAEDPSDRNGEPSEEDPPWDWGLTCGVLLLIALVGLVIGCIFVIAATFPADGPYSLTLRL